MFTDMVTHQRDTFLRLPRLVGLKAFVQDLGSHKSYLNISVNEHKLMRRNGSYVCIKQGLEIPYVATISIQRHKLISKCLLHWRKV